jgi:hypothetical protein
MYTVNSKMERSNFIEVFLPLIVILSPYVIPNTSISISMIILFIYAIFTLLRDRTLSFNKYIIAILVYVIADQLIVALISPFDNILIVKNLILLVMGIVIVLVLMNSIRIDKLYKSYSIAGIISIAGILFHCIQVYILNKKVTPISILPFLESNIVSWHDQLPRPMSFFIEPSAYACFMIPLLLITLTKKKYIFAVIISLSVFLSTSSLGIFLVCAVWLFIVFLIVKKNSTKLLLITTFLLIAGYLIGRGEFTFIIKKISSINLATDLRLSKGFQMLFKMGFGDSILGIGSGNTTDYIIQNHIYFPWMQTMSITTWEYSTTIAGNFIAYGILGGFLYLFMCIKMCFVKEKPAFIMAFIILIASFMQSMMFNIWGILFILVYYSFINQKSNDFLRTNKSI